MTVLATAPMAKVSPDTVPADVPLVVEYWTVAKDGQPSCDSCDATLTRLSEAVDTVCPVATRLGIAVEIRPRTVATWTEAVEHQIVSSPTIHAAGIDLRPTHADDTDARRWEWRGTTSASVTPEALLDFLIQAVATRSRQLAGYLAAGGPAPYVRQYLQPRPGRTDPGIGLLRLRHRLGVTSWRYLR